MYQFGWHLTTAFRLFKLLNLYSAIPRNFIIACFVFIWRYSKVDVDILHSVTINQSSNVYNVRSSLKGNLREQFRVCLSFSCELENFSKKLVTWASLKQLT